MRLDDLGAVRKLLTEARTIAMVGLSPKEARPSNMVARYLLAQGYEVIPVNPGQSEILGLPCYPSLTAVPGPVDIVAVFRRSEEVGPVAKAAVTKGAMALWMQEGISNEAAARVARAAGLEVIMDRCIKTVYESLCR